MSAMTFEIRDAFRRLLARPGYSLLSLAVLTGGLASFLLMLSMVEAFILKPLPFPEAERLVAVSYARAEDTQDLQAIPGSRLRAMLEESTQLDALGAYGQANIKVSDEAGPVRYEGSYASPGLFELLGARAALGRTFAEHDGIVGAPLTVVLSDSVWRDRFAADRNVIGKAVHANTQPATVIGVMPPGFGFPQRDQVWLPARLPASAAPDELGFLAIGHLRPGATASSAAAELASRFERAAQAEPDRYRGLAMSVTDLGHRFVNPRTRSYLWIMLAAGTLVLLLACANVANLQLVQAVSRQRELAVRAALGAGRKRLLLNVLTESLALSAFATVAGLWLADLGARWITHVFDAAEEPFAYWLDPRVDLRMAAYAALAALAVAVIAGLVPALKAADLGVGAQLREGDRGTSSGGFARFSRALVVAEIALSVVLLCSATVATQSLRSLISFDLGTHADPARIMTGRVALFPEAFPEGKDQVAFFERVTQRLRAEPGVESVTAANILPGDLGDDTRVRTEGMTDADPALDAYFGSVDEHFAKTYGVDLLQGRWFDAHDTADGGKVVIVDQRFVDKVFAGKDALGHKLLLDPGGEYGKEWRTIVGITRPLHIEDVDDARQPLVLAPMRQVPQRYVSVAARLSSDPVAFGPVLAAAVRAEDPNTPVYWLRTQAQAIEKGRVGPTVLAQIFGGFGALGLLLAAAGIYGVMAFTVAQRTREIGLRRAIGASARDVTRTVAGRSAWQVGLGLAIGLVLGVPWALLLGSQSPDDSGADLGTFVIVVATILVAAVAATLIPTRRALAVDPMVALRYE